MRCCADAVGMWSIPLAQRPAGQAYLVVIMHALGDVPSPPVVGAIQGETLKPAECDTFLQIIFES